jgi:hypothetical protein
MRPVLAISLLAFASFANAAETPAAPKGEFAPGTKEQDLNAGTLPPAKAKAFTATADEVTTTGFVSVAKNGTRDVHTLAKDAAVLQGAKLASFSDIKAGDTVTGLRALTETGYTVTKITKFVSKPAKAAKPPAK